MARPRTFSDSAVLDAAMDVFWEKGYEATTTQDLCERTGLQRGSLYNAFAGKHAIYEAAIKRYAETRAARQLQELAPADGSVRERLRELMVAMIDLDLTDPGRRGCLALNAATETSGRTGDVSTLVHTQFKDLEEALTALIAVGQQTGELSADRRPRQVARMFQSAYYGLRVLAKVTDDRQALLDVVDGTIAAL
ncbi:TetR/AcrR family transcriptional regulator [Kribbella sp. NPDC049174]|uniref:TetR/AcrR family transcriptional regulator n=1 Tax=Kribbella sp. NPDC049174 TaxID=3364112 RepID=UPI00372146C1